MEESVFDFWFFPRKRIHLSRPQRPATGFQTVSEVLGASATQLHILSPQAAYLRSVVQRLMGNWGQELGLIYGTEDGWRGSKSVEQIDNIYSVLGFREFRGTDVLGTYHSKEKKKSSKTAVSDLQNLHLSTEIKRVYSECCECFRPTSVLTKLMQITWNTWWSAEREILYRITYFWNIIQGWIPFCLLQKCGTETQHSESSYYTPEL